MLLSRRDFRAMMYYEYVRGTSIDQCYETLIKTFGDTPPSRTFVEQCFREFKKTHAYLEETDKPHTRVITTEYVDAIRRLVKYDPRIRKDEIQQILGIRPSTVDMIIDDYLKLNKRLDCWVPKTLSNEDKQERIFWCKLLLERFDGGNGDDTANIVTSSDMWIYRFQEEGSKGSWWGFDEIEGKSEKAQSSMQGKRMISCFFSRAGYITTIPLDSNLSRLTVQWLTDTYLPRLISAWKSKNTEKRELFLHHEKTRVHTAAKTIKFIHDNESRLLPHPPHSPDLAPVDFFLFPAVRKAMQDRRFDNVEEAITAYTDYVDGIDEATWRGLFDKWFHRIRKCIRVQGDYFEEL